MRGGMRRRSTASVPGIWPFGGAWLALHFWDHYDFTRDREFLRTRGYPVLKEATEFLLDYMVEDAKRAADERAVELTRERLRDAERDEGLALDGAHT